ncbi:NUDIX hydrolase [Streptomyces sp. NPDC014733]|uniref:NUDIX hydrolase n=1 Tax=Streptomyces sp. NPDC014733 TaxID=3364885 RepID=UPI0037024AD1
MIQATEASAVTRAMTDYLHKYPGEQGQLMPLYDALSDHARRGLCPHGERCPEIYSGGLLLNEDGHVLVLRNGDSWAFSEGAPEPGDLSLRDTAYGVLREYGGVRKAWALPGVEGPVIIDVTPCPQRLRVGFRYLFVTHTSSVSSTALDNGLARWIPLGEVADPIAARIRPYVTAATT